MSRIKNFVIKSPVGVSALLCGLVTLIPYLNWDYGYYYDWFNHLWMISRFAKQWLDTGSFPLVLHTPEMIGIVSPIFYGYLFYPFMAIPAALFGTKFTVVAMVFFTQILLFYGIYRLIRLWLLSTPVAILLTSMFVLNTYSLTNLFNRNAMTEFFAVAWMSTGSAIALRLIWQNWVPERRLPFWVETLLAGFLVTLSAGSHPITAVYGAMFFVLFILFGFKLIQFNFGKVIPLLAAFVVLPIAVLFPWVILTQKYMSVLEISHRISRIMFYSDRIDTWLSRLSLIPYDPFADRPLKDVSTPFLEAPIQGLLLLAILIIFVWVLKRRNWKLQDFRSMPLALFSTVAAVALTYLSLETGPWDWIPPFFHRVQFGYRLVSYVNFLFVILAVALARSLRIQESDLTWRGVFHEADGYHGPRDGMRGKSKRGKHITSDSNSGSRSIGAGWVHWGLIAIAVVSIVGIGIKISRAFRINVDLDAAYVFQGGLDHPTLSHLSRYTYSPHDYTTALLFPPPPTGQPIKGVIRYDPSQVQSQMKFEIGSESPNSLVGTNVFTFPWNQLVLDGQVLPREKLFSAIFQMSTFHFLVEPGSHTLEYRFTPEGSYYRSRGVGFFVFWSWLGTLIVTALLHFSRAMGRRKAGCVGAKSLFSG